MLYPIKLVIFDFDGVLVDSEYLSAKIAVKLINNSGCNITIEELVEHYSGYVFKDILKALEAKYSCYFSATIIDQLRQEFIKAIDEELELIAHVKEIFEKIKIPYCICSNSSFEDISRILKHFKLYEFFKDRIFSASELGNKKLKPDPNIFLYAAQQYGLKPEHCLVIEDSVPGIIAAKKSGMRIAGFTGGKHSYQKHSNLLSEAGAETVYANHQELPLIINALENWKDLDYN